MSDFSVIGHRVHALDAVELATGQARFGADIVRPGMLYAKVLRSPVRTRGLSESTRRRQSRYPGSGRGHGERCARSPLRLLVADLPVLARHIVRYIGEPWWRSPR